MKTLIAMLCPALLAAEAAEQLLPMPQSIKRETGTFVMTKDTSVSFDADSEQVGSYFAERLRRGTGWPVPVVEKGSIRLEMSGRKTAVPEAHTLEISTTGITIRAATPAGIVRGTETLLQLMPPAVYGAGRFGKLELQAMTITDAPQTAWRGMMLDVSRRFQNKDTILKLLDGLASCKLNVFHWHLTDDQGWRLPIDGYPELTGKDPAYSRADIREVVERAARLGIMIVPEIDMPGHSRASCRAYPEIAIGGTMNPGADASYRFVEAVMKDVAEQFPNSPFVHIGADEVGTGGWKTDPQCQALMEREKLKGTHDLYVYFVNRCVAIARQHGKRAIAWDEAFNAKNDPSLIIMSWRGMPPGIAAAKAGRTVIMTPNPPLYINHANSRSKQNPVAYSAHPTYMNQGYFMHTETPAIPAANRPQVWGAEVCLWGERITDDTNMFVHVFPRAFALAENLWMPRAKLDWDSYVSRLKAQNERLDAMKIPYFREPETLPVTLGTWKAGEKPVVDFPVKPAHAGEQEFFITQTTGEGQFRVETVELLKDGVVVDTDRHRYDSSVYNNVSCMYIVKNPDTSGKYTVRVHATPLSGDCTGIIQHTAALAPDGYSKQCAPGSGANRTKQTSTP